MYEDGELTGIVCIASDEQTAKFKPWISQGGNRTMTKVALLQCNDYVPDLLKAKIVQGLSDIGFDVHDFNNKRVALKPNLLMPASIKSAVATHPEFVGAVVDIVQQYGGTPVIIESPAMTPSEWTMQKSGYSSMLEKSGVEIASVNEVEILFHESSARYKRFEIAKAFHDVDIIINLPKLKNHGITYITGAVKNLFGTISGLNKSRWHLKASTPIAFSEMLLDLNEALLKGFEKPKPILHIMDAIIAQEGEGPGPSGTPKKIGAIIIGSSPIAVDYVAVKVAGLDIDKVHTITAGFKRDLGVKSPDDIVIVGESIDRLKVSDFVPTNHAFITNFGARWPMNTKTLRDLFTERPLPLEDKCTLCYQCKKICPAGAIDIADGKRKTPTYNYKKCIRCYCCKEICPEAAITLKKGALQWLM